MYTCINRNRPKREKKQWSDIPDNDADTANTISIIFLYFCWLWALYKFGCTGCTVYLVHLFMFGCFGCLHGLHTRIRFDYLILWSNENKQRATFCMVEFWSQANLLDLKTLISHLCIDFWYIIIRKQCFSEWEQKKLCLIASVRY